jgi:hypothetical protein
MLSITNTWALIYFVDYFMVIFLSVDGVILYGELLSKEAAIYGGEKVGVKSHKDRNILV